MIVPAHAGTIYIGDRTLNTCHAFLEQFRAQCARRRITINIKLQFSAREDRLLLTHTDGSSVSRWWITRALALNLLSQTASLRSDNINVTRRSAGVRAGPKEKSGLDTENARLLQKMNIKRKQDGVIVMQLVADEANLVMRVDSDKLAALMERLRLLCFRCRWLGAESARSDFGHDEPMAGRLH